MENSKKNKQKTFNKKMDNIAVFTAKSIYLVSFLTGIAYLLYQLLTIKM